MKKSLPKGNRLYGGALFLAFLVTGCFLFYYQSTEKKEIDNVVMTVNEVLVTKEDIRNYSRKVSRDYYDDNLSFMEIEEKAKEKAVKKIAEDKYFKMRGVEVSSEEVESELEKRVLNKQGVETEEEFFDFMESKGFLRMEVKEDILLSLKYEKVIIDIIKRIEDGDEEVVSLYEEGKEDVEEELTSLRIEDPSSFKKEIEGPGGLTFVKSVGIGGNMIDRRIARVVAQRIIDEEIKKVMEGVDIVIY